MGFLKKFARYLYIKTHKAEIRRVNSDIDLHKQCVGNFKEGTRMYYRHDALSDGFLNALLSLGLPRKNDKL